MNFSVDKTLWIPPPKKWIKIINHSRLNEIAIDFNNNNIYLNKNLIVIYTHITINR